MDTGYQSGRIHATGSPALTASPSTQAKRSSVPETVEEMGVKVFMTSSRATRPKRSTRLSLAAKGGSPGKAPDTPFQPSGR